MSVSAKITIIVNEIVRNLLWNTEFSIQIGGKQRTIDSFNDRNFVSLTKLSFWQSCFFFCEKKFFCNNQISNAINCQLFFMNEKKMEKSKYCEFKKENRKMKKKIHYKNRMEMKMRQSVE